jgi:arylsulfatase A-like enzyme
MKTPISALLTLLLTAALLTVAPAAPETAESPNIILILADDMSYDSVSAFNDELGGLKTPRIDRLIDQGMHFTDGHSGSAVCTPTRYGLLTGRYCWRTRLKHEVLWSYGQPLLRDEELTLPELLKEAGYHTGMVGKWHLGIGWKNAEGKLANGHIEDKDKIWRGAKDKIAAAEASIDWSKEFVGGPRDHGFDFYFGVDLPNMGPFTWLEDRKAVKAPTVPKPDDMFGSPCLMVEGWKLEAILPGLRDRACAWITEAAKKEEPFFLYLPLTSPHTPISPSKEFAGKSGITPYVDFVLETDDVVGRVLDALEATGEADNTLLIFTADNGTASAANFKQLAKHGVNIRNNYRASKASIYEGGHRVPFIVRWPKLIQAGSRNDQTVSLNDWLATFAEMTGRKLKDSEGVDSTSLWPLITGKSTQLPNRPGVVNHSYRGQYAIRDGDWKLILPMQADGKYELYHLKQDQRETNNLASQHPERVARMTATLRASVENGRSTPGKPQPNHGGETSWLGLPW